jgi:L-malate glycosyltransferase
MKITFLMPCYMWVPSGGFRVVYEYANRLVARGHHVTVVHPRHLKLAPPALDTRKTLRTHVRLARLWLRERVSQPTVDWHPMDSRVKLLYVPDSGPEHIPDADVLFATGWDTAPSVLACPPGQGEKCHLIQGYETWMGPKELVDDTWRAPLRKIVVARWLLEVGETLGCRDLTYIPNAVEERYRIIHPIEKRPRRVAMIASFVPLKGSRDGVRALEIAKTQFPDLEVTLFGNSRRAPWIPKWMSYTENPPQDRIVGDFYNRASIFLSPSWTEGFPLPPAEAAACGCAILATDIGGHRDYLENGVSALLSPPKDPDTLARNLCLLLANDKLRVRLALAANESVTRFSWEHNTDLFERFLKRVSSKTSLSAQTVYSPVVSGVRAQQLAE